MLQDIVEYASRKYTDFDEREFRALFERIPEKQQDTAWQALIDGYQPRKMPTSGTMYKVITACGVSVAKATIENSQHENFCYRCGHRYPLQGVECPSCRNRERPFCVVRKNGDDPPKEICDWVKIAYLPGPHPVYGLKDRLTKGPLAAAVAASQERVVEKGTKAWNF